jgi:iron complex transport system substrate-binding protein
MTRETRLTRRTALALGSGTALAIGTCTMPNRNVGAQRPGATPGATAVTGGEWTFTDDRGVTVTLPHSPERIAGHARIAGALYDYGIAIPIVLGKLENADGSPIRELGDFPADAITWLGNGFDEFDLEAVLAAKPDVFITVRFPFASEESDLLWGIPNETRDLLEAQVPIIALDVSGTSIPDILQRFEDLAVALGADPQATGAADAKASFATAQADLRAVLVEKPDLTVTVISAGESLYIINPTITPELQLYADLGMTFRWVESDPLQFSLVSWERIGEYSADLFLKDDRESASTYEQLAEQPLWSALPAVQAGQLGYWRAGIRPTYLGFTPVIAEVTETVRESRDDVV